MEYTNLGSTDLKVSRVAMGCHTIAGDDWGGADREESMAAIRQALDEGITLFDTADVYGLGRSETLLAEALGPHRHEVVIATKFGFDWEKRPDEKRARTWKDIRPARVVETLEDSLRRLRLETIPLYQVHWPDGQTAIEDTMAALLRCREQGKIQHIGCCNFPVGLLERSHRAGPVEATQVEHNAIDSALTDDLASLCQERQICVMAYSPLAQGLLTGKYGRESAFGADDLRSRSKYFADDVLSRNLERAEIAKELGRAYGRQPAQVAIRWVLDSPGVDVAICGVRTPQQVGQNTGAVEWTLESDDWRRLRDPEIDVPVA